MAEVLVALKRRRKFEVTGLRQWGRTPERGVTTTGTPHTHFPVATLQSSALLNGILSFDLVHRDGLVFPLKCSCEMGCATSGPAPPPVGTAVVVETGNADPEEAPRPLAGIVRYVGPTVLGPGTWVGVELDGTAGDGLDGCIDGHEYFTCRPGHGLFVQSTEVIREEDTVDPLEPTDQTFGNLKLAVLGVGVGTTQPGRLARDCGCIVDIAAQDDGHKKFVALQMRALQKKFPPNNYDLRGVARMFLHMRRMLNEYDARQFDDVAPPNWQLKRRIAHACCRFARDGLQQLLQAPHDAQALTKAVGRSLAFERELENSIRHEVGQTTEVSRSGKPKTKRKVPLRSEVDDTTVHHAGFKKVISGVFEPHLHVVIASQRDHLLEVLDELIAEELTPQEVFLSSKAQMNATLLADGEKLFHFRLHQETGGSRAP